jgi:hypothetical protein|tara:strand:- start:13 stop:300 length:288 start_codon:yes stop_codon:yes gene_type:complete
MFTGSLPSLRHLQLSLVHMPNRFKSGKPNCTSHHKPPRIFMDQQMIRLLHRLRFLLFALPMAPVSAFADGVDIIAACSPWPPYVIDGDKARRYSY